MELLVTGGNGFIGREVCRLAVEDGHTVTSVARSGPPDDAHRGRWAEDVQWVAGDVFAPDEWRAHLDGVDAVVHSIGIISESPTEGVTFERINGDAGIVTALESERAGVDRFVYVSSSVKPPLVRDAYITAKRRAERAIADLDVEIVVLRPGPVYGPAQPHFPTVLNRALALVGRFEWLARRGGTDRPLALDTVARATYDAAVREDVPTEPIDGPTMVRRYG